MRIGVFTVSALIVIVLLGTQKPLPQGNEDLGILKITVDKCNYTVGEQVRITFSNIGGDNIWWPEEGAIWKVPFTIFDEKGDYVFVTIQMALTIPWALGPGEHYNTTWDQTYNAPDTPIGLQVPPGAYRIYSIGLTGGFPSNITTEDSIWIWIGLPCGGPSLAARAGPDIVTREGEPVMFNGTASSGHWPGHWEIRANITAPRYAFAHAVLDGRVYVAGGYGFFQPGGSTGPGTTEVYDPVSDTWTVLPVNEIGCGGKPGIAGATVNGRFYAFGEYIGPCDVVINSTEVLDETQGRWLPRANMPTPRTHHAVTVIDGKAYAVGGRTYDWNVSAANEVYDPATDSWEVRAPMPTPRSDLVAVVVQGRLYAIGGSQTNLVEAYDPSTDSWSMLPPIPVPGLGNPAAAVHRDLIYLVDALGIFDTTCCSLVLIHNPATGETLVGPEMNVPRFSAGLEVVGDTLIAVGGTTIVKAGSILGPTGETEILQLSEPSLILSWDMNDYVDSDGDGNFTNDIDATGPTPTWIYGDNGILTVTLKATDESGNWDFDTTNVTVLNVDPTISNLSYEASGGNATILFRIAGEKWHNVEVYLFDDDVEIGYANITRYPGSPNDQMVPLADISIDFSKKYSTVACYTPEDDPINGQIWGATPAWFILKFDNEEKRIHHTFNVRHEDTWVWTIEDMNQYFPLPIVTFEATASDPGSDDLKFIWDFGDGTSAEHIYYNDGMAPDPYPSPDGVFPFKPKDVVECLYTGSMVVSLTVWDDDGGSATTTIALA